MSEIGIVTYGSYVPRGRIFVEEIAKVWGADGKALSAGLGVQSKSVPEMDEDVITMGVEATRYALRRRPLDPHAIGAVYVGSESHPYAVKPSATVIAEAIGATPHLTAADYEFACKAGTAAVQAVMGLVSSGMIAYGLAIGSDTSQGAPGDPLEYTASAGATAFVIGPDPVAAIRKTYSFTTDTPDFWRREGQPYPSHGGRFTGAPAYFRHVVSCGRRLMEMVGATADDYQYVVLHQPNGKFPMRAASMLGFSKEKTLPGLLTPVIGNTYSAATMTGLSAVLDNAKPGDRILMVSYGSGAGSDAFDIEVTDAMASYDRGAAPLLADQISMGKPMGYAEYAKKRGKIMMPAEVSG